MDHEKGDDPALSKTLNSVDSVNTEHAVDSVNTEHAEHPHNLVGGNGSETILVIESPNRSGKNEDSKEQRNVPGSSKASADELKTKDAEDDQHTCVIDVKCGGGQFGENLDGERVCRICHLSSDQSSETTAARTRTVLVHLGCGCKDELGMAHSHCAEAWFTLKGNRMCEICGETAKNVTGVGDNRFMEEWDDRRSTGSVTNLSDRSGGCWRGQPFCNFLLACLVIAFVLPWFFRVNMF